MNFYFTNSQNYYHYFRNYIYNHIKNNENYYLNEFPVINKNENIININEYIQMINTNGYFSGELEIFANAKAFNINILIIECIEEYKGYIKKEKFEIEANTTKPILILEYTKINKLGHFNVVHIKPYENIKDGINHIPLVINNKYNYRILQKINQNDFKYIAENNYGITILIISINLKIIFQIMM